MGRWSTERAAPYRWLAEQQPTGGGSRLLLPVGWPGKRRYSLASIQTVWKAKLDIRVNRG
jgi:hypothetical protein